MQDKTILITGAARRLGAELARTLHAAGANIIVHYRNSAAEASALACELETRRADSVHLLAADLLDTAALPALIADACAAFGTLHGLINNASSFYPTPLGEINLEQWDDLIGSNLRAPLFLAQAAAAPLRASGGAIINMIDIHARRPLARHPVYCAAKAGLAMLTLSLAHELGPQVRVNGIAPGAVLWPEAGGSEDLRDAIVQATALKRAGEPADIARTALFLMRDAPYITGQIIAVDGGRSLQW